MYRLHQYTIFIIIIQILEFIYNLENGKITGMIIPSIFLKRKREKLDGRTWINEFGKLVVRFRSKLEGRRESCQFESNPDLAHQPFHRRILACNVTCSLRGQLFRNWTGERGQTSFQTNDPATLSVIYIFRLDPTPLDRPTIFIHFFHFVNTPRNFDIWRMKLINIPGHVLYIYSLP